MGMLVTQATGKMAAIRGCRSIDQGKATTSDSSLTVGSDTFLLDHVLHTFNCAACELVYFIILFIIYFIYY